MRKTSPALPQYSTRDVRGKTFTAIREANEKVNRALIGAALSLGNNIEIVDIPGYAPLKNAAGMIEVAADAAALALPELPHARQERYTTGSTDMGDLSTIMPVIHPYISGAAGKSHGSDYKIVDPDTACMGSALWQLTMIRLLLENGATRAKKIVEEFVPEFASAKEFLAYQDSMSVDGERIVYTEGGANVIL